jgi:UDP-N-acetylmuramate--alanine ligase
LRPTDVVSSALQSGFNVQFHGKELGRVNVMAPGDHNIRNALAAIAIGLELGMPFEKIKLGLERFTGVFRRFQIKYDKSDIMVIDDYAHHPTEVKATIGAARKGWPEKRIVAVFQPHLYSRTRQLKEEFGLSFFEADVMVITDVYPSREKPVEGVSGKVIADLARDYGHRSVQYVQDKSSLPGTLRQIVKSGDIVITMGAGDIYKYGDLFIETLKGASQVE